MYCVLTRFLQVGLTFTDNRDDSEFRVFHVGKKRGVDFLYIYSTDEGTPLEDDLDHLETLKLSDLRDFIMTGAFVWT